LQCDQECTIKRSDDLASDVLLERKFHLCQFPFSHITFAGRVVPIMLRLLLVLGILALGGWFAFFSRKSVHDIDDNHATDVSEESSQVEVSKPMSISSKDQPRNSASSSGAQSIRTEMNQPKPQREPSPKSDGVTRPVSEETMKRIAALGLLPDEKHPSLGKAYRDRRGLVWGEIKRNPGETEFNDVTSLKVPFEEAVRICKEEGNRLPTRKDFERLARDFGVRDGDGHIFDPTNEEFAEIVYRSHRGEMFPNGGYNPFRESYGDQIFPTLSFQGVWTSTFVPNYSDRVYSFNSSFGLFQKAEIAGLKSPFLCVFDPNERERKAKNH
jgi:hypothetical protein